MESKIVLSSKYFSSKLSEFEDDLSKIESIDLNRNSFSLHCEEYWIEVYGESILEDGTVMVSYKMDEVNFKKILKLVESIDEQPITLYISQNRLSIKIDYF